MGRGGSKKSKLVLTLSCGVRLKSCPIPALQRATTFVGWEKSMRGKVERGGLSGVGKNCHSYAGRWLGKKRKEIEVWYENQPE